MSFLLLNGWRLPARDGSAAEARTMVGTVGPAWTNQQLRREKATPTDWTATLAVLGRDDPLDADTVEAFLAGKGHHFRLDTHAFSSQGLGPDLGGTVTFPQRTSAGGMVGTGHMSVVDSILWDAQLPDTWTVAYWRNVTTTPEHVAVRSDGAKWSNGTRADATLTPELVVDTGTGGTGALAFVGPITLDDLVAVPVEMSAASVVALYRLQSGKGLRARYTFDGHVQDEAQRMGLTSVATNFSLTFVRGVVGQAARSNGPTFSSETGTVAPVFGLSEWSLELWVKFVSTLARTNPSGLVDRGNANPGYRLATVSDTDLRLDAKLKVGTQLHTRTANALPQDVWHHVVVTWTQASGALAVYVDGVDDSVPVVTNPGSAAANDAAGTTIIAANCGADFDEVRLYGHALTADEVVDHYNAGARGIAAPVIQAAPDFPALKLDGGIVGWRPRAVMGDADSDQDYIQHGGSGGWVNNSRDVPVTLTEVEDAPALILPEPWVGWALSETNERTAAQMTPAYGARFGAGARTGSFQAGAFRRGRALAFGGGTGAVAVPSGVVTALAGLRALTVLAFLQRSAAGTLHTILDLCITAGASKVRLEVQAANTVRLVCRPSTAEVLRSATSTATITDTDWHMVAASLDLVTDTASITVDDVRQDFTGLAWTAQTFTAEQAGSHNIGLDLSGANRWAGAISHVMLWPKVLTAGELAQARDIWTGVRNAAF